jgi:2-dehydro-3-deoxyphosphooctonate aldolase (KDO 8-P synthase)
MKSGHTLFPHDRLFLIAGPCVVEGDDLNFRVGEHLARLAERVPGGIIFKASFDKANRSNARAPRGPGLDEGLAALDRVRARTGLPILTDVHLPEQCAAAAQVADVLQIPAFLCRQTDLLVAAGATGRPVNVKKGQWLHAEGMKGAVEKVFEGRRGGGHGQKPADIAVTERGTFFGYGDLVVDMRSFARMRAATSCPVIFDATHSVQQPGKGADGASGGLREMIPSLTFAAIAAGANALFMETRRTRRARRPRRGCVGGRLGPASMIAPAAAKRVRLVGLDVDGVLTDGGLYLGTAGEEPVELKRYDTQDGIGIQLMRDAGIVVVIVTGRESASVRMRAAELQVDDTVQDTRGLKLPAMRSLLKKHGVASADAAYIGDDITDLGVLRDVGLPVAVANAAREVRDMAQLHLTREGGHGAVREFAELLLSARGEWDALVERFVAARSGLTAKKRS